MEIQKLQDIYGRHPMIRRLGKALARADVRSIRLSGLQGSAARGGVGRDFVKVVRVVIELKVGSGRLGCDLYSL